MAFGLMDTFVYKGQKPNFSRDQFQTIKEMVNYPEYYLPDTFIATCIEDGCAYLFNRNNPISAVMGRWKKLVNDEGIDANAIPLQDVIDMFDK